MRTREPHFDPRRDGGSRRQGPRSLMRRSWVVPLAAVAGSVLYVVLVGWLMLHGHLDTAVWLVLLAVVALLGLGIWQWRGGHRRARGPGRGGARHRGRHRVVRLQPEQEDRHDPPRRRLGHHRGREQPAAQGAQQGGQHPADGGRQPPPPGQAADRRPAPRGRRVGPRRLPQRHDDGGAHPGRPEVGVRRVVPRDSYVPIYDAEGEQHGQNKINEAFSPTGRSAPGGPSRTSARSGSTT